MRAQASFRLLGPSGKTAHEASRVLGIEPSKALEIGTPVSSRSTSRRDSSLWLLQSAPKPEDATELSDHLDRLLGRLEPLAGRLWQLEADGYWANWFCYVGSSAAEHAVELDRQLLGRLLTLPGDLWRDVYEDEATAL